jgi:hypothetical protein
LEGGALLAPLEPWHPDQFAATIERTYRTWRREIPFAYPVVNVEAARDMLRQIGHGTRTIRGTTTLSGSTRCSSAAAPSGWG